MPTLALAGPIDSPRARAELPERTIEIGAAEGTPPVMAGGVIASADTPPRWVIPHHNATRDFLVQHLPGPFAFITRHPDASQETVTEVSGVRWPLPGEAQRLNLPPNALMVEMASIYARSRRSV